MEIGQFRFTDSGPPFQLYELFIVSPVPGGSSIQRVSMTNPVGAMCLAPLNYGIVSRTIETMPEDLFGKTNPCKVPEKDPESDNCIVCPYYSAGTRISMQVPCGSPGRMIQRFWPEGSTSPKPPKRDAWMVELMRDLNYFAGGVARTFPISESEEPLASESESRLLKEIGTGKYDSLFQGAREKLSNVYAAMQNSQRLPTVRVHMDPIQPEKAVLPTYPSLALRARIEGAVTFNFVIDGNLAPSVIVFENGNPLLRTGVPEALSSWRFPVGSTGQKIEGVLEYRHNCLPLVSSVP